MQYSDGARVPPHGIDAALLLRPAPTTTTTKRQREAAAAHGRTAQQAVHVLNIAAGILIGHLGQDLVVVFVVTKDVVVVISIGHSKTIRRWNSSWSVCLVALKSVRRRQSGRR